MNNDWLDIDVLEDYLDGKLDAKAMHFVERQALEDPFVAEALEGLKQSPKRKQTLSILQKQLYDRVLQKPIRRKMWGITTQRLSIAATATVAFIAVSILFFMRETNRKNAEIASRKSNGVMVDVSPKSDLAAVKEKQAETAVNDGTKSALIDKAITEAKSGDLAKNNKAAKVSKNATIAAAVADNVPAKQERPMLLRDASIHKTESARMESVAPYAEKKAKTSADVANSDAVAYSAGSLSDRGLVYSGNVISQSGQPVSGAVIKVAGTKAATTTDNKGYFSLPVDSSDKNKEILVKAQGFDDKTVSTDPNAIRMALSGNYSLNEIAVMTGSSARRKVTPPAAPKIVLRAVENLDKNAVEVNKPIPVSTVNYTQYLERNNKLLNPKGPEQFVIVSFKVKKNGRPSNVKVVKSINKNADAEAKRLVLAGPDWVLPKKGTDSVELSIKF
ncbi:carboxypeptidase-like regulatory domain-containing protein [Pedobacter aquatilis]|uniref:carboxypeptidase-like regulatory domain-containing protein n=1 Tax=Pedobacter aquatilis TaxID=351343 RepID=UPI0025B5DA3B|nr:carboxypeptidase-like regulatory domain-containing protein [Pedobacter aquatilis]MDN3586521.1 carboxypeptidase-like regulatory domain-containing protein [Pedobacter aquatilis]